MRFVRQLVTFVFAAVGAPWLLMSVLLLVGYPDRGAGSWSASRMTASETYDFIATLAVYSLALAPAASFAFLFLAIVARGLRAIEAEKDLMRVVLGLLALVASFALVVIETVGFYMPISWPVWLLMTAGMVGVAVCDVANADREPTIAELWHRRRTGT
jgi:hypothetical protein